jgi:hypothetical protein
MEYDSTKALFFLVIFALIILILSKNYQYIDTAPPISNYLNNQYNRPYNYLRP